MTLSAPVLERPDWLPLDVYPFEIRTLHLPSGDVAVVDEGRGPTLLFVHAGTWSFVWRDLILRLRDRFRCVAVDFPGFGLAPDSDGPHTLAGMTASLEDLTAAIGLGDVVLVVHDLGGPVGLKWATDHPDRIRGLVLANTFAWRPDRRALTAALRLMSSAPVTAFGSLTNLVPRLSATRFGVGRHLDRASRRAWLGPFRDRARRRSFHRLLRRPLVESDHLDAIERGVAGPLHTVPALTVFGERNDPFGFQSRHEQAFADHEGLVIPNGNHFPMMDDPQLVAATISSWYERHVTS